MNDTPLSLDRQTTERLELAFRAYWYSPLCPGKIELGEALISWALNAQHIGTKAFTDAFQIDTKIAYQIKTGLPGSPVTFARLTTPSQATLVNSTSQADTDRLGAELLTWVHHRINEPRTLLGATDVQIARLIYSTVGNFTFYVRSTINEPHDPANFTWCWSEQGKALEGYYQERKWFSWYPQGRANTKNQNQLHFHGENALIPPVGAANRYDFYLGRHGRISFDDFMTALEPLLADLRDEPQN